MAGPWEKYQQAAEPAQAAAPVGPWTKFAPAAPAPSPRTAEPQQGFIPAFEAGVKSTGPTLGKGIEGVGIAAELEPIEHVGRWLMEKTKPAETGYVPLQWKDIHEAGDVWTWVKEQAGAGAGSMLAPAASALTGAVAGGAVGGPIGATIGTIGGAASVGGLLNVGDAIQQFEDEGIDKRTSVKAGIIVGSIISVPDVFALGTLTKPFTGAAKKAVQTTVIRHVAGQLAKGATIESATEGLQQLIQETAAEYLGGESDPLSRVERVVGSTVAGGFGGAVLGGAGGVMPTRSGDNDAPASEQDIERFILEDKGTPRTQVAEQQEGQLPLPLGEPGKPAEQPPVAAEPQVATTEPTATPVIVEPVGKVAENGGQNPPINVEQQTPQTAEWYTGPEAYDKAWEFVNGNPLNLNRTTKVFDGTPEAIQMGRKAMRTRQNVDTLTKQDKPELAKQAQELSVKYWDKAIELGLRMKKVGTKTISEPVTTPKLAKRYILWDNTGKTFASFNTREEAQAEREKLGRPDYKIAPQYGEPETVGTNPPVSEINAVAPELVDTPSRYAARNMSWNPEEFYRGVYGKEYDRFVQSKGARITIHGDVANRLQVHSYINTVARQYLGGKKLIVQLGEHPNFKPSDQLVQAYFQGGKNNAPGFIYLSPNALKSESQMMSLLSHELGHAVMWAQWANTDTATQQAVYRAFIRHLERTGKATGGEWMNDFMSPLEMLRFSEATINELDGMSRRDALNHDMFKQWFSFDEWIAEQVNRYLIGTGERAQTVAEKWFSKAAELVKRVFSILGEKFGAAEPEIEQWLNHVREKTGDGLPQSLVGAVNAMRTGIVDNALALGRIDVARVAPPQTENIYLKQAIGAVAPTAKKQKAQMDQYTSWLRFWPNLLQLTEKNKHITGLTKYTEYVREWQIKKMKLISRSDGTVKDWRRLGKEQSQKLSNFMFDLDAMVYLKSGENARWPTADELVALAKKHGLSRNSLALYPRIRDDFLNVLAEIEAAWKKDAQRSLRSDPLALQQAMLDIGVEMAQMRSRPYFPHERFGDWTVTHWDQKGKVLFFAQFPSAKEANAFASQRQRQFPQDRIGAGKLAEEIKIFRGLPPSLIRQLASKLKNLTSAQREQLEQLAFDMSPANSFAKHQMRRKGTPGYSNDGLRSYASYFLHAGNHIARLEWRQDLEDAVDEVERSARDMVGRVQAEDVGRRQGIADWLKRHLDYIMNPPNEWNALRSFAFFWYMGFNPSSALVNMTQIPMVAWPYMAARFGDVKSQLAIMNATKDLHKLYQLDPKAMSTDEIEAIREGILQGFLDESQNADLAGMAQHGTLGRLVGGTKLERFRQNLAYYSSYLFQAIEKANRRIVFRAAYRLAKSDPTNKHVIELVQANTILYRQLLGRGWNPTNAGAFLLARDAIEKSQFNYAAYARPEFIRGKKGVLFAFWMFKQNMLYFFKNDPGGPRAMLVMLAIAGLSGLPFAEDASDFIKYASRLFGHDFNPEQEARELIRDLAGVAGADDATSRRTAEVLMEGFGKESFGLAWAAQGLGIPFPGVDVSSRLGMGRLIPGLEPFGQGLTQEIDPYKSLGQVGAEVLGASYGVPINVLRALETGDLDEYKTWERLLPTAARNVTRAIRYLEEGGETSRTGASIAQFDVTDTGQAAELAAQALGFTPTRVSREWDKIGAQQEAIRYWTLRRKVMFEQFDRALRSRDREALADAKQALRRFNGEVPDKRLRITGQAIRESLLQRAQSRRKMEAGVATSKTYQGISSSIADLYPEQ